jgi:outer membrane protein assembly factor BamD (BamD/ComL family)
MKRIGTLVLALTLLSMTGCAGDKGKELYDTAQFEEKQHNREHAIELYREIVTRYPRSAAAPLAEERLKELTKAK